MLIHTCEEKYSLLNVKFVIVKFTITSNINFIVFDEPILSLKKEKLTYKIFFMTI